MLRIILALFCLSSSSVFAQAMLDVNAFYLEKEEQRSSNDGTQTYEYTNQQLFFGLGICFQTDVWCFGGKYLRGEIGGKNHSGLLDGSVELEGFGVSAGYVGAPFFAQLTYFIEAEKRYGDGGLGGDTNEEYPAETAYMLDIGYGFNVGSIFFGPNLKWFQFKYTQRTLNGQTQSLLRTEKDIYLMPMFSMWTFF